MLASERDLRFRLIVTDFGPVPELQVTLAQIPSMMLGFHRGALDVFNLFWHPSGFHAPAETDRCGRVAERPDRLSAGACLIPVSQL
jgi:hypothetical protein